MKETDKRATPMWPSCSLPLGTRTRFQLLSQTCGAQSRLLSGDYSSTWSVRGCTSAGAGGGAGGPGRAGFHLALVFTTRMCKCPATYKPQKDDATPSVLKHSLWWPEIIFKITVSWCCLYLLNKCLLFGSLYSLIWTKCNQYFGRTRKVHENEILSHLPTTE